MPNLFSILVVIFAIVEIELAEATFFVSRNPDNVKFILYKDPRNPEAGITIPYGNEKAFADCGYNSSKPLTLLIHDVLSNSKTPTDVQLIKNAYLEDNFNANIVIVDYGKLTTSRVNVPFTLSPLSVLTLLAGRFNSNTVAKRVAEFIGLAMKARVLNAPRNVHIVGFGLGAHIAGGAGRQIKQMFVQPVRRITGLDPTRHLPIGRNNGLDRSDAQFVDVTYTSILHNVGIRRGHVQFYLNGGGPHQPNCPNLFPFTERYCSHTTAVYYFAKSVNNKQIPACKCMLCRRAFFQTRQCSGNDLSTYGQCVPESARGNFFVGLS